MSDDLVLRAFVLTGPDPQKSGACFGDSGGAAFLKTANGWRLAAVIEGGAMSCEFLWDTPASAKIIKRPIAFTFDREDVRRPKDRGLSAPIHGLRLDDRLADVPRMPGTEDILKSELEVLKYPFT